MFSTDLRGLPRIYFSYGFADLTDLRIMFFHGLCFCFLGVIYEFADLTNLRIMATTDYYLRIYGFNGFTDSKRGVLIRKSVKSVNP
jgi:hypothetical protein